ncbi:MAG: hypothetical protein UY78_C0030G0003 [Parcubacteria group bacterium GW2011_GWA1_53_13]|nr:MAG: hypothetical protein UY78_C0030G0003 [Parcubacteria group bacterium GW2011_GWA1_53_13]
MSLKALWVAAKTFGSLALVLLFLMWLVHQVAQLQHSEADHLQEELQKMNPPPLK